ncbi:50S ribosomal protein L6 [Desulfobulbus sp.]|jgi:large subunit ribosomal protein L6|uniref:50S ribosomal protein L6 n=1 Tax=Desulfobulbus sp. TaxID=895 RepID=UPI0027BA08F3|nr:50S ribosomal protein L6 [Desulfobulbus sp.]
MSRIGKQPIPIPTGIKVEIQGTHVTVLGGKGTLERDIRPEIDVNEQDNMLICTPKGTSKKVMALWGMTRSLINNMIVGVHQGFAKKLMVEGVGYRANINAQTLTLNVGYSNGVEFILPEGITATVDKDNSINIQGIDKELVGLTAAQIRDIRKPEPYKGKGIRYFDEHIVRKVGKAGGKK